MLSSTMQEIHLTIDGQDLAPPAAVVSDTEETVVGEGGVAVLMKPIAGQRLTVEHAGGACVATLPDTLPGYETIVDLDCKENP
ncbi:hypothetical protein N799_05270 [Lysobacter arseniciresistens ZS79]|uniref:Uncharacterized protein n=1 Tax=Lysobacter arseniciresistens ZS79 TaxID=913325 RepID=A0A0A0F3T7_9GAMM|nr:hypothetical protein N799_05270 [Lysobacter arseniciresistens ZS79]